MRPAKSFWKKGQLCRTTWRWLCQRTRLVTLAMMPALEISDCRAIAMGRPIGDDERHSEEKGPCSAKERLARRRRHERGRDGR